MRRTLIKVTVSSLILVGVVGLMHMPFARDLLQSVGGCPFPTTDRTLTAQEAETLRQKTLAPERSLAAASARPALGFALERTTRAEVLTWATTHKLTCKADRHGGAGLTCADVRASMLPEPGEKELVGQLMLGFTPEQALVSVHYMTRDTSRPAILARSQQASLTLSELGPQRESGDPTLAKPLSQLRREVRFRDYLASISATNMGQAYSLSESYQAFAN